MENTYLKLYKNGKVCTTQPLLEAPGEENEKVKELLKRGGEIVTVE